jgi:hypothetical protein
MLLRYEVQEYGLADADLSAVPLPTVRVPLYHRVSPGTIGCIGEGLSAAVTFPRLRPGSIWTLDHCQNMETCYRSS